MCLFVRSAGESFNEGEDSDLKLAGGVIHAPSKAAAHDNFKLLGHPLALMRIQLNWAKHV